MFILGNISYPTVVGSPDPWNPLDKASQITLSNSDRTFTGVFGVRSTASHSTGKYYLECKFNTLINSFPYDPFLGFAPSSWNLSSNADFTALNQGNQWSLAPKAQWFWSKTVSGSGTTIGTNPVPSSNDVIGFAIDLDAHKMWYALNGVFFNASGSDPDPTVDPVNGLNATWTDISGTLFITGFSQGNGGTVTANFKTIDQVYTAPTGFGQW